MLRPTSMMRAARALSAVVLVLVIGCDGHEPSDHAPVCTAELGCPEGSVCVQGLYCEGPATPGGRVAPPATGDGEDPSGRDGGRRAIDGGRVRDASIATGDGGPICIGSQPCGGRCVDVTRDSANCGACGLACPAGTECVLGACVEPLPGSP